MRSTSKKETAFCKESTAKKSKIKHSSQKEISFYSAHIDLTSEQYTNLLRKANREGISVDEIITRTIKKLLQ